MNARRHFFIFLLSVFTGPGTECIELTTQQFLYSKPFANSIPNENNEVTCTTDEECQYFIEQSKCEGGYCKCAQDWVLSSDRSVCLEPAKEFGSPCQDNTQCSALMSSGGVCTNGSCKCKQGYHYLRGSCWKDVGLREECIRNEQCFAAYEYIGLECQDQICQCRSNYYQRLNSGCRRQRKNGEFCNLESDCTDGTTCKGMYCSNSTYVSRISDRPPLLSTAEQTKLFYFYFFFNPHNRQGRGVREAVRDPQLGRSLAIDSRAPGVIRQDSARAFTPLSHPCRGRPRGRFPPGHSDKTRRTRRSGESLCTCPNHRRMDLSIRRRTQTKRDLKCPRGEFELNGKCVLELGMKCEKDDDCNHIAYAYCLDRICGCEPVKMVSNENNRKCLQVARGNVPNITKTSCKENAQCSVFGENAFCQNQKCACKSGSYWDDENKFCWMIKSLGETCSSDRDCHPEVKHAECVESVCTCRKGYHTKDGKCILDAMNVGDYCEEDRECLFPNSYCDEESSTCLCENNYYEENKICRAGVGSPCESKENCDHIRNTDCKFGNETTKQCLCLEDHISSDDYKYCLPIASFRGRCTETFQCTFKLGKLAECKDESCQCQKTAHYSQGKCHPNKFIGDPCSGKLECVTGNDIRSVICLKGYCACHYDYTLNKNGICVKRNSATSLQVSVALTFSFMFLLALRI